MNTQKLEKLGFKIIEAVERRPRRHLDERQLIDKFKRVYRKDPTVRELEQYRLNYRIFVC
jgi:hypothetical protein